MFEEQGVEAEGGNNNTVCPCCSDIIRCWTGEMPEKAAHSSSSPLNFLFTNFDHAEAKQTKAFY
jgi:hypothetical protein